MKKAAIIGMFIIFFLTGMGEGASSSSEDVELVQRRIQELEQEMAAMKEVMSDLAEEQKRYEKQELPTVRDLFDTRYQLEFYGMIKFDAIWNSSKVAGLDGVSFFALPDRTDSDFSMTARQTRLGLSILGPEEDYVQKRGNIEVDFYGMNDAAERQDRAHMRLRHAFLELDYPGDWSLLAGQTWDVISPLAPQTLDLGVRSHAGNAGFRSPQIRLTRLFQRDEDRAFKAEMALSSPRDVNTRYHDDHLHAGAQGFGQDSGGPVLQARTSYNFPGLTENNSEVGVSGHFGRKEYHETNVSDNKKRADTWSVNLDYRLPLTEKLLLMGEGYYGRNMEAMYAGIGEGVAVRTEPSFQVYEISSWGTWAQMIYQIDKKWRTSLGMGISGNRSYAMDRAPLANFRTRNIAPFANVIYQITDDVSCGLEVTRYQTSYYDLDDGKATRLIFSMQYNF